MKNTGTSIDTLSTQADKIKTGILNRAIKKKLDVSLYLKTKTK